MSSFRRACVSMPLKRFAKPSIQRRWVALSLNDVIMRADRKTLPVIRQAYNALRNMRARLDSVVERSSGDRVQTGGLVMARTIWKTGVKSVPRSEIRDDLSRFLHEAEKQEIVIPRHGKPAGVLIGFESEDVWFDY